MIHFINNQSAKSWIATDWQSGATFDVEDWAAPDVTETPAAASTSTSGAQSLRFQLSPGKLSKLTGSDDNDPWA